MECGSQDLLCELTNWLSENEMVGPWLVEVIGRFGAHAQGIAGSIAQFVRDYGQSIVGLIGGWGGTWIAGLIPALTPMLTGGGAAYVGQAVTGVVGGGILTAVVGLIKNMASPK